MPAGITELTCQLLAPPNRLVLYLNKGEAEPDSEQYDFVDDNNGLISVKTNGKADTYSLAVARLPGTKVEPIAYSLLASSDSSARFMTLGVPLEGTIAPKHSQEYVLLAHPEQEELYVNL